MKRFTVYKHDRVLAVPKWVGPEIEAESYAIDERGALHFEPDANADLSGNEQIVVVAPGEWSFVTLRVDADDEGEEDASEASDETTTI